MVTAVIPIVSRSRPRCLPNMLNLNMASFDSWSLDAKLLTSSAAISDIKIAEDKGVLPLPLIQTSPSPGNRKTTVADTEF